MSTSQSLGTSYTVDPADVVLDAEFERLIPGPGPQEQAVLTGALHNHGAWEPLVVWPCRGRLVLLVGYEAFPTIRLYRLPCRVVYRSFPGRAEARMFIIRHHMARQYLTPLAVSYLRGLQYIGQRQAHGGDRRSRRAQNGGLTGKTAEALGELFNVSPATIRLDAEIATAVLEIAAHFRTDVKPVLLGRSARLSRGALLRLAQLPLAQLRRLVGELLVRGQLSRPSSDGGGPKTTITVPRDPARMPEAILRKIGADDASVVCRGLTELLQKRGNEETREL
jgi:hypothetical protein